MNATQAPHVPLEASHEADLITAAQTGDRDAYLALVRHHLRPLYRLMYAMSRSEMEAVTLTLEAFARAWREIAEYPSGRRFYPWLLRVARRHSPRATPPYAGPAGETAILGAIDALRADDRMTLALRTVERHSYREIAALLDIPTGLVSLRLAQARGLILSGTGGLEGSSG